MTTAMHLVTVGRASSTLFPPPRCPYLVAHDLPRRRATAGLLSLLCMVTAPLIRHHRCRHHRLWRRARCVGVWEAALACVIPRLPRFIFAASPQGRCNFTPRTGGSVAETRAWASALVGRCHRRLRQSPRRCPPPSQQPPPPQATVVSSSRHNINNNKKKEKERKKSNTCAYSPTRCAHVFLFYLSLFIFAWMCVD